MSAPINKAQIIEKDGKPIFAVIPYEDYMAMLPLTADKAEENIPHEVVGLVVKQRMNLVKAWRKHLGLTQKEVAQKAGVTQAAISQMEKSENTHRSATLEKLAVAMGLSVEQLRD